MPYSYVLHETSVVCTNMTNPKPGLVVLYRNESGLPTKTLKDSKQKFILNAKDNKLSCSLSCKMPQKFWAGLAALCVGIAFVAACILTGGAMLVVVGAALAVAAVSAGVGAYKTSHACDATLSYTWILTHSGVNIDQAPALLNKSLMNCEANGGLLSIIIDPVTALDAAKQIAKYNSDEVGIHMLSQFFVGMVSGIACSNPVSAVINLVANVGFYCAFEPTATSVGTIAVGVTQTAASTAIDAGAQYGIHTANEVIYRGIAVNKAMQASTQVLGRTTMEEATEAYTRSLAANAAKTQAFSWKSMRGGIIAGVITTGINVYADMKEAEAAQEALNAFNSGMEMDQQKINGGKLDLIALKG